MKKKGKIATLDFKSYKVVCFWQTLPVILWIY